MKEKIKCYIFLLFLTIIGNDCLSQNLIENPSFEDGAIPNGPNQVSYASFWGVGCGDLWITSGGGFVAPGTPDLFDDRSPNCAYDIPSNKWAVNTVERTGGHRYVGMAGGTNTVGGDGNYHYQETVIGTLKSTLGANCIYNIGMWTAAIDGFSVTSNPCTPSPIMNSNANAIEVVLRKTNCSGASKIIFSSSTVIPKNWINLTGTFTLTTAEAAIGYDKIEFRLKLQTPTSFTSKILFLDDVSITPPDLADAYFTLPNYVCYGTEIVADGVGSINEQSYLWDVTLSDAYWNTTWDPATTWSSGWILGTVGISNLTTLCNLNLQSGNYYRVRLAVSNCVTSWDAYERLIYIRPLPFIYAGLDQIICQGQSVTLGVAQPPSNTIYSWIGPSIISGQNTSTVLVNPSATSTYTLNVYEITKGGCSATDQVVVNVVNPLNNFNITSTTPDLCSGSTTLSAPNVSGAHYLWSPGNQNTSSINVSPNSVTTYSCTMSNLCSSVSSSISVSPVFELTGVFNALVGGLFVSPSQPTIIYDNTQNAGFQPAYNAIEYQLRVWDRWGHMIYDYTNYDINNGFWNGEIQWDGKASISTNYSWWDIWWNGYLNSYAGQYVPQGAYVLQLRLRNCNYNHWVIPAQTVTVVGGVVNKITDTTTVISDVDLNSDSDFKYSIYPNPTSGSFNIEFETESAINIEIMDYMGKIILKEKVTGDRITLDISNQPSGVYLVKIISNGNIKVERIIKN